MKCSLGGRLLNTTTINMSMTGHNNTSPPCSPSNPTNDDAWPRFLFVEAADENSLPLTRRCSIFALNIAIKGMGGNYKSVKQLNRGRQVLVHFDNKKYSENLLIKTDKLVDIPVKVSPHRTLNYKRCVIFCKELAGMDEEEIANELKSQGVVKVERMKRWSTDTNRFLYSDCRNPNNSQGDQSWIPQQRNKSIHPQSTEVL